MLKDNAYSLINSFSFNDNALKHMRLYDHNGIKIKMDYYISNDIMMNLNLKDLETSAVKILSYQESQKILREYKESDAILTVQFKMEKGDDIDREDLNYRKKYGKKLNVVSVLPAQVETDDYEIDTVGNMINNVKSIKQNLKVIFKSEEIKDEYEMLPLAGKVYYSYFKREINLLHLHSENDELVDLSKKFEILHLDKNEDVNLYKNFDNTNLKVKILFKNFRLCRIFYKNSENLIQELKAEENNFKLERIMKIQAENTFNNFYAKIKKIPVYLLAAKTKGESQEVDPTEQTPNFDKVDACNKPNDEVPGYIDLSIVFDDEVKYLDIPINISLPVCMLKFISLGEEMELEKIFLSESKKRNVEELTTLEKISLDLSSNFQKYVHDVSLISSLPQEEVKRMKITLEGYKDLLPKIGTYIQEKEMWALVEVKFFKFLETFDNRFNYRVPSQKYK